METENRRMSLEICTDCEEDWKAFIAICAKSFQNSAPFRLSHPDPEKRKKFLPLYFKYLYENVYSGGRAGLVCLKLREDNGIKPEIVLVSCAVYKPNEATDGDKTAMRLVDEEGMNICFKQDHWAEVSIHSPMRKVAAFLGTFTFIGDYHAATEKYLSQGLGRRYVTEAERLLLLDGKRRLCLEKGLDEKDIKTPVTYGIVDDTSIRKFQMKVGHSEIAHLHFDSRPGLKCFEDPDAANESEFSCVFVVMYSAIPDEERVAKIRHLFNTFSSQTIGE